MKSTATGAEVVASPYSAKTIDAAIQHLERVLSLGGVSVVLSQRYWRGRVRQIECTPGLTPGQQARVALLPKRLENAFSAHRENVAAFSASADALLSKQ
jgi:hypothetical protein